SRAEWEGRVGDSVSLPLKIEIVKRLDSLLADWVVPDGLEAEWELFTRSTVEGIITTNYDSLLSTGFPDYRLFIGQEGLLFSDTQGIAEIYAIHGSTQE